MMRCELALLYFHLLSLITAGVVGLWEGRGV